MKSLKPTLLSILAILAILAAAPAFACDLCACYTPRLAVVPDKTYGFYGGAAEQFTYFGTDRQNGKEVANPTGQYMASSNTQLFLGVTFFNNRAGVQFNVPLIYRSYKRPEGFDIERGHVSGIGDVSLLANWVVFKKESYPQESVTSKDGKSSALVQGATPDFSTSLNLIAGLKFPTGDSSRLAEEFHEVEVEGAPESGIHGHDLALGTGSYDGVFGAQFSVRYKAVFFQADAQFTWRGMGSHSYRYANDFIWSAGPGVYLVRNAASSLALIGVVSGETKGLDTFLGQPAADSGITSLYLGPAIVGTYGRFSGQVGVDLPVLMNTTAFQTTPDYRIRAGFAIQF